MKLVVGISGASGAIYGIKLLKACQELGVETHLIVSEWAEKTIVIETPFRVEEVKAMASYCYENHNLSAVLASGSFVHQGMVIVPCSMKTLSAIACGFADSLMARAADVTIKEKRKLVLVPRETPLSAIHLENMLKLANLGVVILPPMPAMYSRPQNLDEVILHSVGRILDQFGITNQLFRRWEGK